MTKKRILITGATGFFGKNLTKRLGGDKDNIYLTSSHGDRKLDIFKLDLLDYKRLRSKIKEIKPQIIYHLGGLVNLSRDIKTAQKCIDINIKGTLNLLESLKEFIPDKFIYTSTEEVYGKGPIPYKEDQLPHPPSGYAISKIAIEHFCKNYAMELGFQTVINRIGTSYGPGDSLKRLIPQIIYKALKNENIPLNSGKKRRDYVYIDDVIDALVLEKEVNIKSKNEVINIGGGIAYSLIELVEIILSYTKSRSKLIVGVLPERALERKKWLLDITKARELLEWKPKTSFKAGLIKTINDYKKML